MSYPIGNDPGAITVATILSHYSPSLTGVSTGHHPTVDCFGPRCTDRLAEDGLNAAISGSMAKSLVGQVQGKFALPREAVVRMKS